MLWPRVLLKAGEAGLRAAEAAGGVTTPAKSILHLAEGNNGTFRWWFDEITKRNVPFDIIGLSYYPLLARHLERSAEQHG